MSVQDTEKIEKVRQAIMRYRELLDLAEAYLKRGERDYNALFAQISFEQRQTLSEKLLQGEAAKIALEDISLLQEAILKLRLSMRNLEHDFEHLYDNLIFEEDDSELD